MVKLSDKVLLLILQLEEVDWSDLRPYRYFNPGCRIDAQLLLVRLHIGRQHPIFLVLMREVQQIGCTLLGSTEVLINLRMRGHVLRGTSFDTKKS